MKKKNILCGLLALTFLFSGCNTGAAMPERDVTEASDMTAEITETEASTTAAETTTEAEPFKFNPHIHTALISEVFKEEWWGSFYNMCDAMREGKDTFECLDEECFKMCTNEAMIGTYFPAACTLVVGDGFKDGVGKLKYKMDKDKFIERQRTFEEEIERMLNEAIRSDYSEFEKVLGLYAYMGKHFVYDDNPLDGQGIDDFGDYACLVKKNGICCEVAGAFTYLLLQAGVEATPFEGNGDAGYHAWVYVIVGGKGYFCDPTWGLHGTMPQADLSLQYFMQTENERIVDGFNKESIRSDIIRVFVDEIKTGFPADDETFKPLHDYCLLVEMDTARNVIIYKDVNLEKHEFSYGVL